MAKLKKYFGEVNMTWKKVVIFALAAGIYTGIICLIPPLKNTSFADIGAYLEWWILFAVFIIVNCKKWWEASIKCFVFFLISQPLVYLVQVPFYSGGWDIFKYYGYWFAVTVLTLPGAAIAFLVKKKNWLSVLVMSVAAAFLAYSSVLYIGFAYYDFPHHILSAVFCIAIAVILILALFEDKKKIAVLLAVVSAVFIISLVFSGIGKTSTEQINLESGNWEYTVDDECIVTVQMENGNTANITSGKNGNTYLHFKNEKGEEAEYYISVNRGNIFISEFD